MGWPDPKPPLGAERVHALLDGVIASYRQRWWDATEYYRPQIHAEAVKVIADLGFLEGDAHRWLIAARKRRVIK
jgi:hypothetical protein